jgi:hypothetical protein
VRVHYFEGTGLAIGRVSWAPISAPPPDGDGDGVADGDDNCPSVANANQSDLDGDGNGDACDSQDNRDSDGDGVQNHQDNCPNTPGPASNGGCPLPSGSCPTTAPAGYVSASGSPLDEIQSGQNVFIPNGTYAVGRFSMANGQKITGTGRNNVTLTSTSDNVNSSAQNAEIACLTLQSTSAGTTNVWMQSAPSSLTIRDSRILSTEYGIAAKQVNPPTINVYNTEFRGHNYGFTGNLANSEWVGNDFATNSRWAGMEINGGWNNRFANNAFHGGAVGLKFLRVWGYGEWGRIPSHDNLIESNTFENVREENTDTDMQGNNNSAVRGTDQVSGVSGKSVTLASSAWTGQFSNGNYRLSYFDGPCKGLHYKIASQSGRTFNLTNDRNADPVCTPNVGDDVVVGQPFYDFTWRNNTIDATTSLAGVSMWGWTYDSEVDNNTISSPDPALHLGNPMLSSIELASLLGMDSTGMVTNLCGREGPVDGITVTNNKILMSDGRFASIEKVFVASTKWGGCAGRQYHPARNTISGNEMPTVAEDVQF